MEAGKRNIGDIFNRMRLLSIPFFQRSYVWDTDNWERLLADFESIAKNPRPYFLGSVILKQQPTGAGANTGDLRIVIDGQQRLTTLLLFFKVLCRGRLDDSRFKDIFVNYQGQIMLQHNRNDIEVFTAILEDKLTAKLEKQYSKSRVLSAYHYFLERMTTLAAIDPLVILANVYFVGIDLGSEEDEQQVFDTINSLGVSLSTAELLKNELFNRSNAHIYDSTWYKAFEASEEDRQYWAAPVTSGREHRENIDLFMQAFLLMRVESPETLRVDELFRSYKQHLSSIEDRAAFIADITETATVYRAHIDPDVQDKQLAKEDFIDRLTVVVFGLSTTTVVPYLLYVLRNAESDELPELFHLLEGYLIRRIVCRETSKNYNRFFGSLIRDKVRTSKALIAGFAAEADTTNRYPNDSMFQSGFANSDLTNKQALVVLWLMELSIRNDKKHSTALSGLSHYSLEHLLPKKWRNNWSRLTVELETERDHSLKKLGNLSLLASGLNTSISDSDWTTKKAGRGAHKGLLDYASGLDTLSPELALASWDEEAIRLRAQRLAKQALSIWPHPF